MVRAFPGVSASKIDSAVSPSYFSGKSGNLPREKHGVNTDALPVYNHVYEDGCRVAAEGECQGYRVGGAFHP